MLNLAPPQTDFAPFYRACSKRTNNSELLAQLQAEEARVLSRSQEYARAGQDVSFYAITPERPVHISPEALADLYNRVLVRGGEKATYYAIRGGSPFSRCPFCVQRDVSTLDHYLSRSDYPEFAILPINLVPSCWECNHAKSSHRATILEESLFHPYFDDWSNQVLLDASINCDHHISIDYYVNRDLPAELFGRVENHFEELGLASLYAEHANIELIQKKLTFEAAFQAGGSDSLREELLFEARSRLSPFPNAWQPVLYNALAKCDQFCNGAFDLIE